MLRGSGCHRQWTQEELENRRRWKLKEVGVTLTGGEVYKEEVLPCTLAFFLFTAK